jgi:hypothetical protein
MDWEIYDLLGYGGLTVEIMQNLLVLLNASLEFQPITAFQRLENFYLRWCDGEFIDAFQENFPQRKMLQLQGLNIPLGLRQVDVYTGLNVMILLIGLQRYAQSREELKTQISLHFCGELNTQNYSAERLFKVAGYCCCVASTTFNQTISLFLRNINLSGAYLKGINLEGASLRNANFRGADLRGANLVGADLTGADFSGANLRGAVLSAFLMYTNFSSADLGGADLTGSAMDNALLRGANLVGANLRNADLTNTNLDDANLEGVLLDGETFEKLGRTDWKTVQGLETAINVPEALKKYLGLEGSEEVDESE